MRNGRFAKQISNRVDLYNSLIFKKVFPHNSFKQNESNILRILFIDHKEIRVGGGREERTEKENVLGNHSDERSIKNENKQTKKNTWKIVRKTEKY